MRQSNILLSAALEHAGLTTMAKWALENRYNDYFSPLDDPSMALLRDLRECHERAPSPAQKAKIRAVIDRHMNGDFDGSKEESDEWAASPEGQDAFRQLLDE